MSMTLPHMDPHVSNGIAGGAAARASYGCAESQERLWEYLDEELPENEAERMGRHVTGCPVCGPLVMFGRALLRRIAAVSPDHGELGALRERIANVLAVFRLRRDR
jgi:hypothetical protein